MKRTAAREIAVRLCFALSENPSDASELVEQVFGEEYYATLREEDPLYEDFPDEKQRSYIAAIVTGVSENAQQLDGFIEKYSVGWKLTRISGTATAIMRVAMFEVLHMPDVPDRAAINEAVELAKKYEAPETRSFINGILGSFSRGEIASEQQGQTGDAQTGEQQGQEVQLQERAEGQQADERQDG